MSRGRKGPEDHLLDLVNDRFDELVAEFVDDEGRRPTEGEMVAMSLSARQWARDELEGGRYDTHPRV